MNLPVKPIDSWLKGIRRRLLVELTFQSLHPILSLELFQTLEPFGREALLFGGMTNPNIAKRSVDASLRRRTHHHGLTMSDPRSCEKPAQLFRGYTDQDGVAPVWPQSPFSLHKWLDLISATRSCCQGDLFELTLSELLCHSGLHNSRHQTEQWVPTSTSPNSSHQHPKRDSNPVLLAQPTSSTRYSLHQTAMNILDSESRCEFQGRVGLFPYRILCEDCW
ncbi:unnamed protein product [Protopolystoma xenopodis]|uniref:Uncharacterized protein n=1 Tax=Protopolystoma xenopodis TaxID=117903 RepID=A0A3S5BVR0_9PLAT|nr:unnamed protein product [Protopolystoma xenopodis]